MTDITPQSLLSTGRSFMEPRVLLTAAELDVFTTLAPAPATAAELAARLGADARGLTALLNALVAMEVLNKDGDRYACAPGVAEALSAESPTSVLPMLLHSANLWQTWSGLTDVVKGQPITRAPGSFDEARMRAFIGAMHAIAAPQADRIVQAVAPGDARRLIDVGGASGTYTIAFLRAVPGMCATLFDQPPVIKMARERLESEGLLERVALEPGDFYADPLPGGHDLAFVSAIIHQNSPAQNVALYRKVFDALVPGGRIVVRDHVMDPSHTRPRSGALFAINMLVGTPGGGTYTFDEIAHDLTEAGFKNARLLQRDTQMDGLIEASRESGV